MSGGALSIDIAYYVNSQSYGGNARIINSTFDGNYVNNKADYMGSVWGGTISYGRWEQVSSKTFMFNSIVTNSRLLQKGSVYTSTENDYYGAILGAGSTEYFKIYVDYSNVQNGVNESWAGNNVYDLSLIHI